MLSKPHQLMLFSLGQCYKQLNKRFEDAPLEVSISKAAFIETLLASGLVGKKSRALYKNLKVLEKESLVLYDDKELRFTKRGYKRFVQLTRGVTPFINHTAFWDSHSIKRKLQAHLKR
jgi:hypothetical protein